MYFCSEQAANFAVNKPHGVCIYMNHKYGQTLHGIKIK